MKFTGVLTVDKEHKKLLNSVRSICEALELMGEDITERVAKSENRVLSYMDGRLSRDLRAVTAVQTELLAKLDRLERSQQIILDRLPEADEMEGLRRRVRYLERALQDHLNSCEEDSFEDFEPDTDFDPLAEYESSRNETEDADYERPLRPESAKPTGTEPQRPAHREPVKPNYADAPRHAYAEPERPARPEPPRHERPQTLRFERYDRPVRPIRPGD